MCGGNFHFVGYPCRTCIERPAEYPRESQYIINLIGEITPAGADNAGSCPFSVIRPDLRDRVCHRKNNGIRVHGPDHLLIHHPRGGNTNKNIRSGHCIGKGSCKGPAVGLLGKDELVFVLVESFPSPEYGASGIADNDLIDCCADIRVIPYTFQQTGNGIAGLRRPRR